MVDLLILSGQSYRQWTCLQSWWRFLILWEKTWYLIKIIWLLLDNIIIPSILTFSFLCSHHLFLAWPSSRWCTWCVWRRWCTWWIWNYNIAVHGSSHSSWCVPRMHSATWHSKGNVDCIFVSRFRTWVVGVSSVILEPFTVSNSLIWYLNKLNSLTSLFSLLGM